jgi:hypothetical protein
MALLALVPAIASAWQAELGSIQGVVVAVGTGAPLSNATVRLWAAADAGAAIATTTTDGGGTFVFPKTPPGTYRVAATRDGYATTEYGQRKQGALPLAITVEAGQETPGIRIEMTRGGVISGRISDGGHPIGNAQVFALKSTYNDGLRTMTPVLSAKTNDLGEYDIFWLPPGQYYLAAIVYAINASPSNVLLNPDGDGGGVIQSRIIPRAVMNRAVGNLPADDRMHVPMYFPGTTDWQKASPIDVQPGAEIRNLNIDAAPVPVWRVAGTVTGITAIVNAAGQSVRPEMFLGRHDLPFPLFNLDLPLSVRIDPSGSFEVPRVPPGPYRLIASQRGGNGGHVFIDVRDRDVNGLTVAMIPPLKVSGRIAIEPQTAAGDVPPVTSFRVRIRQDRILQGVTFAATPKPDGAFGIGQDSLAIQTGDYRVSVEPILMPPTAPGNTARPIPQALRNVYVKSIRLGETDVLNDGLHLTGQPRDELVVVLGTNPGTLEGRVIDVRQQPVAAATVVLIPDGGIRFRVDHRFTSTDASGRFQLQSVPPGNYKLFAWEEVDKGDWQDPDFVRDYESLGKPVRIEEGGKHANFEVAAIPPKP